MKRSDKAVLWATILLYLPRSSCLSTYPTYFCFYFSPYLLGVRAITVVLSGSLVMSFSFITV